MKTKKFLGLNLLSLEPVIDRLQDEYQVLTVDQQNQFKDIHELLAFSTNSITFDELTNVVINWFKDHHELITPYLLSNVLWLIVELDIKRGTNFVNNFKSRRRDIELPDFIHNRTDWDDGLNAIDTGADIILHDGIMRIYGIADNGNFAPNLPIHSAKLITTDITNYTDEVFRLKAKTNDVAQFYYDIGEINYYLENHYHMTIEYQKDGPVKVDGAHIEYNPKLEYYSLSLQNFVNNALFAALNIINHSTNFPSAFANLTKNQLADGFFKSEIGSITEKQIDNHIDDEFLNQELKTFFGF